MEVGLRAVLEIGDMRAMSLELTEEMIARQPPESQAIIRFLWARVQELEGRLLRTPHNSSLPPSVQHPHAKSAKKKKRSKKKRGGQPGHAKHEFAAANCGPAKNAMKS